MDIIQLIVLFILFIIVMDIFFPENAFTQLVPLKHNSHDNLDIEYIPIENYYIDNYSNLSSLTRSKIFIHIPSEMNQRKWLDFGSRNTTSLNLPLSELCIQSIIKNCSTKYDIIIYNNSTVNKLFADESETDLCNIKKPELLSGIDLKQWEHYCKAKLLSKYGGVVMEPNFFFMKCPSRHILFPNQFTICNIPNEGKNVSQRSNVPNSFYIMSSPKNDSNLEIYIKYLHELCVKHYSEDHKHFDKTYEKLHLLPSYDPALLGIKDNNDEYIHASNILDSHNDLLLNKNCFCLFINIDYFKKYRKHGWVLRMDPQQLRSSNTFLSRVMKA